MNATPQGAGGNKGFDGKLGLSEVGRRVNKQGEKSRRVSALYDKRGVFVLPKLGHVRGSNGKKGKGKGETLNLHCRCAHVP